MTYEPTGFALDIFRKRYALHHEETWLEACDRVANHVASAEQDVVRHRAEFAGILKDNLFMPGGRIWYGSGRPKGQLLNCFVAPTGDSREGWGRTVSDMIQITGTGGGLGVNCSPVRPRGTAIGGSGGHATGAVSLMEIINAAGEVIKAGGGRRTALMLCLNLNHGDIVEFLDKKLDLDKLNNANVSVVFNENPDEFFKLVRSDSDLHLVHNGKTVGKVKAREIWFRIIRNALKNGEPGLLNGYLANQANNVWYYRPLISTNPCVPGYTRILTDGGYKRIDSLVGQTVNVWNGFEWSEVQPRVTGHDRRMLRVKLSSGQELVTTENHHYWLARGYQGKTERVEAQHLKVGDKLIKHNYPVVEGGVDVEHAYSQGFLSGDGMDGYPFAYLYEPKYGCIPRLSGEAKPESAGKTKFEWSFAPEKKAFVPFTWSVKSRLDWFAGLLDSDGTELKEGGTQVTSVDREFLLDVQRMLTTLGVASKLKDSHPDRIKSMPDGRGGQKDYDCRATYRLLVGSVQMQDLKRLGLKCERLSFDKAPQRDASRFVEVVAVEEAGTEATVYCFTEPKRNLGCFEGVVTGNCGEIWLTEYDCCCLGALVLPRFIKEGHAELDWELLQETVTKSVRFLDDVLTVNNYPLPEIAATCSDIRRIGLGVMGLHDMLLLLGLRYNSDAGLEMVNKVMKFIKYAAYEASVDLAVEKGAFPKFDAEKYLKSSFTKDLKPSVKTSIREKGIRNCALLTIAPTGTTSMVCEVSSGIEPMFSPAYRRRFRDGDALKEEVVIHPLFKQFVDDGRDVSHFQGAYDLGLRDHFEMQRVCQRHLDNACSKTINLPPGTSEEVLSDLYMEYFPSLKGVTVYPEGSRENQPLTPMTLDEALQHVHDGQVEAFTKDSCKDGKCDI